MEELLNKLIEKGRVPFGLKGVKKVKYAEQYYRNYNYVFYGGGWQQWRSIRQIVNKESGLWQFCVENDLVDFSNVRAYGISFAPIEIQNCGEMQNYDNIHRLLWDCASLDEAELEQFLIDNIKV